MSDPFHKCLVCSVKELPDTVSKEDGCAYGICVGQTIPMERLAPTLCDYHQELLLEYYKVMITYAQAYEKAMGEIEPKKDIGDAN